MCKDKENMRVDEKIVFFNIISQKVSYFLHNPLYLNEKKG